MVRRLLTLAALLTALAPVAWAEPRAERPAAAASGSARLDRELRQRASAPRGHSRVIVRLTPGVSADVAIRSLRGTVGRRLASVGGQVADVPDTALQELARLPGVNGGGPHRHVQGTMER